jgi:heme/copper-type cytochrome/quinol oxidase subunit 2
VSIYVVFIKIMLYFIQDPGKPGEDNNGSVIGIAVGLTVLVIVLIVLVLLAIIYYRYSFHFSANIDFHLI